MNPEAIKCLGCPKPRCSMIGCPVHTAIPECIRLYKEGRLKEAGEILFNNKKGLKALLHGVYGK